MTIRSDEELRGMQAVGRLVARTLDQMRRRVQPGVTTAQLDEVGEAFARAAGARSAPQLTYGFPGFTCISVNEEIVHGIPGPRVIEAGDVVKLDVTLELDGFMADSAFTVLVPPATAQAQRLQRAVRVAFEHGLAAVRAGRKLRVVGAAVEAAVRREGATVLEELSGHGIGRGLHEAPDVPNWDDPRATTEMREGMVFALEPMASLDPARVVEERDGWTLRTHNRTLAAHYEHTVMVRRGAALVLTAA